MVEVLRLVECDGRNVTVWLILLNKLKFKVAVVCTNPASVAVVINILSYENRRQITRAERLELFENPEKLRGNLLELKERINMHYRGKDLLGNLVLNMSLKTADKLRKVLLLQSKAGSICMASEVLKQIRAVLNSLIEVKTRDTSGRTCYKAV